MPTILATSSSPAHGFAKAPQPSLHLIADEGVAGDAHRGTTVQHLYFKRRTPKAPNLAQVHLFASEMLQELATHGFVLQPGEIGENLLTSGLNLLDLPRATLLHCGDPATGPILEVTGLRTPCSQIDAAHPGLQQLLWGAPAPGTTQKTRRAGIMSIVLRGGHIAPNDPIQIELPPEPHQPLGPV